MKFRAAYVRTAVIVVLLVLIGVAGSRFALRWQPEARHLDFWAYLCLVAGPLSLLLRHKFPVLMVGCALFFSGLYLVRGYPTGPQALTFVVAIIFALIAGRRLAAWIGIGLGVLGVVVVNALAGGEYWAVKASALSAWLIILGLIGTGIRLRVERIEQSRRRRQERMAAARSAERLALARDIHDVVAHSLSTINVRASVALHLAQKDPSQIEPALQAIKSTSKEALDEVRELLGVLREDAPLVPASLLERLPKLIEDARGTGLQVSLQSNLSQPLSAEQEAASYRIIQEALTNIVRHAGAQQVSVALNSAAGWLRITVDDDGRGLQGNAEGNGLPGIRERVSGLGGTVEFQPRHPGLSVQVAVPLSQEKVKP